MSQNQPFHQRPSITTDQATPFSSLAIHHTTSELTTKKTTLSYDDSTPLKRAYLLRQQHLDGVLRVDSAQLAEKMLKFENQLSALILPDAIFDVTE